MGRPRTYQKQPYRFHITTRNDSVGKLCESLKAEKKLNRTVEELLIKYLEEKEVIEG